MTRFAWLQARTQTLTVLAALAVLAVVAAVTGVQLSHLYHQLVAHCQSGCSLATAQFLSHGHFMDHTLDLIIQVTPALIGLFWGAPLLTRELENGTHRLVWAQTVTRRRWLLTKLGLLSLATVAVTGLLTLTVTWWYRALDPLTTNQYAVFDRRDIAPIGYALFAFAAGALIGAVIRRTLPAMATTLAVYVFALVATTLWVRPHLLTPVTATQSTFSADRFGIASINGSSTMIVADGSAPHNAWLLSSRLFDSTGHVASVAERTAFVHQHCPSLEVPPGPPPGQGGGVGITNGGDQAAQACLNLASRTFHLVVKYQPADRYWTFQWIEAGIYVALALLAAGGCYWWVTRRTS